MNTPRNPNPQQPTNEKQPAIPNSIQTVLQSREAQRRYLFYAISVISLLIVVIWGGFLIHWLNQVFSSVASTRDIHSLGNLWHIILILIVPPSGILLLLIRSVGFIANSAEFYGKPVEDKLSIADLSAFKVVLEGVADSIKEIKEIPETVKNIIKKDSAQ